MSWPSLIRPAPTGLTAAIGDEALRVWSPQLEHRQRGPGGNAGQYDDVLPLWFAPGESFAEWHYQAQLLHARAMQIAFENCRVNQPWCMGALVWQLNDIWPGLTWSLVDVCGKPKLAMQTSMRAAAVRSIVLSPPRGGGPIEAFALNDTDSTWQPRVTLQRVDVEGRVLATRSLASDIPARSSTPLATMEEVVGILGDRSREHYIARIDEPPRLELWIDVNDRAFAYPAPVVEWSTSGSALRLTARALIRDLVPLDAALRDQTLPHWPATLLPGDSLVLPRGGWSPAAAAGVGLLDRKQWMCANWFSDVRDW